MVIVKKTTNTKKDFFKANNLGIMGNTVRTFPQNATSSKLSRSTKKKPITTKGGF